MGSGCASAGRPGSQLLIGMGDLAQLSSRRPPSASPPRPPLPSGQSPRSKVHSQLFSMHQEFQPAWLQQLTRSWSSSLTLHFVPQTHAWTADACDGTDCGAGDVVGRRAACG